MSLGSEITKARIGAGLSVEDLSATTNIRVALIKEIEADQFSNCGGDTYARGHLRNIALKLEMDQNSFIEAFELEQMHVVRSMQDQLVETNVIRQPNEKPKISWKVLASISISSLLLVGIAQIFISNSTSKEVAIPVVTPTQSPSPTPTQTVDSTPSEQATLSTGQGVEVIVSAVRSKSWVFVSDAGGRTLFSGQIAHGDTKSFTTDVALNLKVGNAGGVDIQVNGKIVESIGGDGEVVSVSYGVDS